MTDGLASGAGAVNVSRMVRIEDGKSRGGQPFGGNVHMLACKGRRGCEEDLLLKRLDVKTVQRHEYIE